MLTLTSLYAGYDGVDVVRNVSLKIAENLCIVGPNGCGKTTLLKAIAGILPHKGIIEIFGKPTATMPRKEIAKNIAMLSQQPGIYFPYSVYDTVMMGRYLHITGISASPTRHDRDIVMQSLEAVNMQGEHDRLITKLSGGQLQRVFLARALAQEPKIILLDEPTNHLDLKCQLEIIEYLQRWAQKGERAIVGVLHDINLAIRLASRIVVMKDGQMQADDNAGNIISSGVLDVVYQMDVAGYMQEAMKAWK